MLRVVKRECEPGKCTFDVYVNGKLYVSAVGRDMLSTVIKNILSAMA